MCIRDRVVCVREGPKLGSQVRLGAHAHQDQARIDEVGLPLEVASGAQIGQQAEALLERQRRPGEVEALADPVAERAPGKIGVVGDRVESCLLYTSFG